MRVHERDPEFLKSHGYLEKVGDYSIDGRTVFASRLGYRITTLFVERFLGRIFETPDAVFPEEMLQPEKQDPVQFAAGVDAIVETQTRVARQYFEDGSVEAACPPLRALLEIMSCGSHRGKSIENPEIRALFGREALLTSDWYAERLRAKQSRDVGLWMRHVAALENFLATRAQAPAFRADQRVAEARKQLERVKSPTYLDELHGTIGADPFVGQMQAHPRPL